jgi:hypothetical protein
MTRAMTWTAAVALVPFVNAQARGADVVWGLYVFLFALLATPAAVYLRAACRPYRPMSELTIGPAGITLRRGARGAAVPWTGIERVLVSTGRAPHSVTLYCRFRDPGALMAVGAAARTESTRPPIVTFTMLSMNRPERNAACADIHRALETFAPDGLYRPHPKALRRAGARPTRR